MEHKHWKALMNTASHINEWPFCQPSTLVGPHTYIPTMLLITIIIITDRSNDRNEIVVVEGRSTNVNIICGLDRINNPPLYWIINQTMYDMSNLPYIFKTTAYGTLTLETVNRRMNHWEIQCVRVTVEELIYGQMATLRVIYGNVTKP